VVNTALFTSLARFSGSLFLNKKSGTANFPTFATPTPKVSFSGSLTTYHHSPVPKGLTASARFAGSLFTNKKSGTTNHPTFPGTPSLSFSGQFAFAHILKGGPGAHNVSFAATLLVVKISGTTLSPVFSPPAASVSLAGSLTMKQNPRHVNLSASLKPRGAMLERQH